MTASPVPARIPASQAAFLDDVRRVLRVWRRTPLLPLVTLAVAVVALLAGVGNGAVAALATVGSLLLVGWPGAERLWYLRLWTGRSLSPAEAWRATLRCFGRFFVLALTVGLAFAVLAIPMLVGVVRTVDVDGGTLALTELPLWIHVYGALLGVLGYALLTFVTPAIVYSSKHVSEAIPIGLRLLRVSWPRTAAYVLVPAVLAGTPAVFLGLEPVGAWTVVWTAISTLALAVGRGTVAAYYLRTVPGAGPDGAVRVAETPGYYPAPSSW